MEIEEVPITATIRSRKSRTIIEDSDEDTAQITKRNNLKRS
jgi:hypothetical protein